MTRRQMGPAIRVGDFEIVPVETVLVDGNHIPGAIVVQGAREPVAIVVRSNAGTHALDLDGRETPLGDLLRDVPGLRAWLEP